MADKSETQMTDIDAEQLRNLIAAMYFEYDKDQGCDYVRINRLLCDAADIVAREIGGDDRLMKLGEAMEHLGHE
jgi:hypothetical protein